MKIEVLFPEFANLYGDLQNIKYLKLCIKDLEVIETKYHDEPYFVNHDDVDMLYMGPMTERSQSLLVEKLMPYNARLEELIEKGVVALFTGNALELFGEYIQNEDESKIECLGIFKTHAERRMLARYNENAYATIGDVEVCAFVSTFSRSYGDNENNYLFDVKIGTGINAESKKEGLRKNNFMGTYYVGPILCINPQFTKYLLNLLSVKLDKLPFEDIMQEAFEQRLSEFKAYAEKHNN